MTTNAQFQAIATEVLYTPLANLAFQGLTAEVIFYTTYESISAVNQEVMYIPKADERVASVSMEVMFKLPIVNSRRRPVYVAGG